MEYSIYDIAKRAGVSKSTVSRVLNSGSVSEKSRNAVLQALKETGYQPNQSARTLRGAQSYVIGIHTISSTVFSTPVWMSRIAGIIDCLYENGYSVLFINAEQKLNGVLAPFRFLEQNIVDGLIFMQNAEDEQVRREITRHREIVYTGERILPDHGFRIYMGNYDYSRTVYDYMMQCGHTRILTLWSSMFGKIGLNRRFDAYLDSCRSYGVAADKDSFKDFGQLGQAGELSENIYRIFADGKYTAIFTDDLANANFIDACFAKKGLVLGRDFSLAAIERSNSMQGHGIATVKLSDYEYGVQAARMLLRAIEEPQLDYLDVQMRFEFNPRESIAVLK